MGLIFHKFTKCLDRLHKNFIYLSHVLPSPVSKQQTQRSCTGILCCIQSGQVCDSMFNSEITAPDHRAFTYVFAVSCETHLSSHYQIWNRYSKPSALKYIWSVIDFTLCSCLHLIYSVPPGVSKNGVTYKDSFWIVMQHSNRIQNQ